MTSSQGNEANSVFHFTVRHTYVNAGYSENSTIIPSVYQKGTLTSQNPFISTRVCLNLGDSPTVHMCAHTHSTVSGGGLFSLWFQVTSWFTLSLNHR